MNNESLQKLWPTNTKVSTAQGLYLNQIENPEHIDDICIYANLVSSVDGRIAIPGNHGRLETPSTLTTKLDWALFKELQAQADCLITHGGYFRSLARGELGDILRIGEKAPDAYLREYRANNQLAAQPNLLILSRTLDFELPPSALGNDRSTTLITGQQASSKQINKLESLGVQVIQIQSHELIDAKSVYSVLKSMGAKRAYLQTGPHMLGSMLSEKLLNRLYLTISLRLIGGDQFLSLLQGELPEGGVALDLAHLYLDERSQLFARLDVRPAQT